MPKPIPSQHQETPLRRQISGVSIDVEIDTGTPAKDLPTLTASITFTDLWTRGDGVVVSYPVPGMVRLSNEELLALPNALAVIAAIQERAYQKAIEQGL